MTPLVQDIISKATSADYFDGMKFLKIASDRLRRACSAGEQWDSHGPNRLEGQQAYFEASNYLEQRRFTSAAGQLLTGWWNEVGTRQLGEKEHIDRARSAWELTQLNYHQGDSGAALRWALLTHADDLLHKHPRGGGAAMQYLRMIFGASKAELDTIRRIADRNLATMRSKRKSVSKAAWFAEDIVVKFALTDLSVSHLFSRSSIAQEFPLSSSYLKTLLEGLSGDSTSTRAKGDKLEFLASYLFLLLPGWFPSRNLLDENLAFESDIMISNLNPSSNLTADLLGRNFLVECKNWEDRRVSVRDVGYFLHRMRMTHCSFGIIFAVNDVTGQIKKDSAARNLILRAFHEDGNTCIVLTKRDLSDLEQGKMTFWSLLLREMQRSRFGKPRTAKK